MIKIQSDVLSTETLTGHFGRLSGHVPQTFKKCYLEPRDNRSHRTDFGDTHTTRPSTRHVCFPFSWDVEICSGTGKGTPTCYKSQVFLDCATPSRVVEVPSSLTGRGASSGPSVHCHS